MSSEAMTTAKADSLLSELKLHITRTRQDLRAMQAQFKSRGRTASDDSNYDEERKKLEHCTAQHTLLQSKYDALLVLRDMLADSESRLAQCKSAPNKKVASATAAKLRKELAGKQQACAEQQQKASQLQSLVSAVVRLRESMEKKLGAELDDKDRCRLTDQSEMHFLNDISGIVSCKIAYLPRNRLQWFVMLFDPSVIDSVALRLAERADEETLIDFSGSVIKQVSAGLKVQMTYNVESWETIVLKDVKVDVTTSMSVDDVVRDAIVANDTRYLLSVLQQRWSKHYKVVHEIETLRNRFALDWLPDNGIINVIYGGPASPYCTLQMAPGYPDSGGINLVSVVSKTGVDLSASRASLQAMSSSASLTEWLEQLRVKLVVMPTESN